MTKRIAALLIGTCFISFGIAAMSKAAIGMSPLSCFPYVMSLYFSKMTLGNWVLIWNTLFAILQIPIEGKNYRPYQLTQIPLAFLLGYCTDFANYMIRGIGADLYVIKLLCILVGTILTSFGVYLTVNAKLVMNGPEAFLASISAKTGVKFGTLRTCFDVSNVILAIVSSLLIYKKILGIREGTVFAAIFTGIFVNIFTRLLANLHKNQK